MVDCIEMVDRYYDYKCQNLVNRISKSRYSIKSTDFDLKVWFSLLDFTDSYHELTMMKDLQIAGIEPLIVRNYLLDLGNSLLSLYTDVGVFSCATRDTCIVYVRRDEENPVQQI